MATTTLTVAYFARPALGWLVVVSLATPSLVRAQIRTDGSVGLPAQSLVGPRYQIPESLGKLAGGNLFHSFQTFNVNAGESANFTTSSAGITNVISRVTGGSLSQINGRISLTATNGAPNFYFINPAGVTFGAGASVDVPGAFHVSTANYLRFPDGVWYADTKSASTFSSAPPEAFGFLGTTRPAITIRDNAAIATKTGQAVSFTAGDVALDNGSVKTLAGDIRIAAVGNDKIEVPLSGTLPAANGNLTIRNGGLVETDAIGARDGGNIVIRAGDLVVEGVTNNVGGILATSPVDSTGRGGAIDIATTRDVSIFFGGQIVTNTSSSADGGTLTLRARNMTLDNRDNTSRPSAIGSTVSIGRGNAGIVDINISGALSIIDLSAAGSATYADGNAGSVNVTAGSILIDGQGILALPGQIGLFSVAAKGSTGVPGNMTITALGDLVIRNEGEISAISYSSGRAGSLAVIGGNINVDRGRIFSGAFGAGDSGNIEVSAVNSLSLVNGGQISSQASESGNAGSVKVSAANILIDNQNSTTLATAIFTDSQGAGNAGAIDLAAQNLLEIKNGFITSMTQSSGLAGPITIKAQNMTLSELSSISSATLSSSDAGRIDVHVAENLSILSSSYIDSNTYNIGKAGSIKVVAGSILIDGQDFAFDTTGIFSKSRRVYGNSGNAGSIDVIATGRLALVNRGFISSGTDAEGAAGSVSIRVGSLSVGSLSVIDSRAAQGSSGVTGSVNVMATDSVKLVDGGKLSIANDATATQPLQIAATDLNVTAGSIILADGGEITAASTGNVGASNINVNFRDRLSLRSNSSITTSANNGNGGSIAVRGGALLELNQSQIMASVTGTTGRGGDIAVKADALVMQTGFIQANTAAAGSNGGDVRIDVLTLVPSNGTLSAGSQKSFAFDPTIAGFNVIQAAAPTGLSGDVRISSPTLNIAGSLIGLATRLTDVVGLGRNPCRASSTSSFSQTGRGGFAPSGRNLLAPTIPMASVLRQVSLERFDWRCANGG